jgi:chromosome segregation ATPase
LASPKVLSLGKKQINLLFRSLTRTFAQKNLKEMNIFSKNTDKPASETEQETPVTPPQPLRNPKLLNATQLQRIKETKRLAETKLSNIEESLQQLRKQQEWLRRYNRLKMELKQEKTNLFELNKQQASMAEDIRQLERFEMCESIQGAFQRLSILKKLSNQNNKSLSLLERESDDLRQAWSRQEKLVTQMENQLKNAEERLYNIHDQIFHACTLQGSNQAFEEEIGNLAELTEKAQQQVSMLESNVSEAEQNITSLSKHLSRHKEERQSMEMHEQMIQHTDKILLLLDNLQDIEEQQQKTKNLQADTLHKQNEENRLLERVFSKYQDIISEIETLESELQTHRNSILGQDSYKLQERAMQLKSLKQMLISAQSLWHQISVGYNSIEEKTQTLNELRHHIEKTEREISIMETEVGKLSRLRHEKKETYLLSKGQNIIQLRADLKEGISCSVCGATHHPYHSDTMLEQSKLIGEFKTDYELLSAELRNKRQQLDDLRMDLAESKGRQFAEECSLKAICIRQNEDIKEWGICTSFLDPSIRECSSSTNQNARMALIRHMIESTATDAENATKELNVFNFHMAQITRLGEELQALELQKKDLSVRLNEVNTGCQVRAGQMERVVAMMDTENTRFSEVYHHLEECVTIKDWKGIWDKNHEALREQIIKLENAWNIVNKQILKEEHELALYKAHHETLLQELKTFKHYLELVKSRTENRQDRIETNENTIRQTIGAISPKQLYEDNYQLMDNAKQAEKKEQEEAKKMQSEINYLKGRNEFHIRYGKELAEKQSEEHSRLDLWIRNFNMHHPPVQYTELQKIFSEEKDWVELRSRVLKIRQDALRSQTRVDELNSQFIALQAEGNYRNADNENLQESLASQMETLERKRHEVMMQIARQTVALEDHEKAIHTANNSALNQMTESEQC